MISRLHGWESRETHGNHRERAISYMKAPFITHSSILDPTTVQIFSITMASTSGIIPLILPI